MSIARFEKQGHVGIITIDNPPINLADDALFVALAEVLDEVDASDVRAVLLQANPMGRTMLTRCGGVSPAVSAKVSMQAGKAYGYTPAAGEKGKRVIVEAEARIVRRIFEEHVEGRTPREIAHDLNNENVSPPRGRSWNASTINGNLQRGTGIIQNELYAGRLVWNKVRMIKDPDTGKRLSRPNAKSEWQTADVPDLRIIPQTLFDAAQNRKKARGQTLPNRQRRPRHMLSGLLRCGSCGAGMSTSGRDRSHRVRIRCSAATESGTCRDAKTFYLATVESAVLSGLEAEMRHPSVIAEYVRTYHEERKRLAAKSNAKRAHL